MPKVTINNQAKGLQLDVYRSQKGIVVCVSKAGGHDPCGTRKRPRMAHK